MATNHKNLMGVDIDALVPHRRPLRLIDEILRLDVDSVETAAVITEQWPLLADGAANPIVLIELVAQTAAVFGGLKDQKKNNGVSGHRGLIVGIKSANFFMDAIPLNSRIVTRSTTRLLLENFKEIIGVVQIGKTVIAEITLQSLSY